MTDLIFPTREIIYFNIPSFPTEVATVMHPEFKDCPMAIAPPNSDQSKILACNDLAKLEGIQKQMPLAIAKRMCRSLKVFSPEPDLYRKINSRLIHKVSKSIQLFEVEREGKIYLDFSGFEKLYGPKQDFAFNFQKEILNDFKLQSSVGMAKNKLVSKIAAKSVSYARDIYSIQFGEEKNFLSPLSHMLLPISRQIKERQQHRLGDIFDDLNIHTIHDLRSLSRVHLLVAFKDHADIIYQMARGIDHRPLLPPRREVSIAEEMQLIEETNSLSIIQSYVYELLERATFKLRHQNRYAQKIYLAIRYSDYKLVEVEKKISKPFQMSYEAEKLVFQMLSQVFYRRTNIRYITLELKSLVHQYRQLSLFDLMDTQNPEKSKEHLSEKLDAIRKKFGFDIIKTGRID